MNIICNLKDEFWGRPLHNKSCKSTPEPRSRCMKHELEYILISEVALESFRISLSLLTRNIYSMAFQLIHLQIKIQCDQFNPKIHECCQAFWFTSLIWMSKNLLIMFFYSNLNVYHNNWTFISIHFVNKKCRLIYTDIN